MKYLLDVNVLLALGYWKHDHSGRVRLWMSRLQQHACELPLFVTCAITELGFVRIASGGGGFAANVNAARLDLRRLQVGRSFAFVGDEINAEQLPAWVERSKQTTDGHLSELARCHGATLATLDTRIPGALLIPHISDIGGMVSEPVREYGTAA